jgi:hypothetical protein
MEWNFMWGCPGIYIYLCKNLEKIIINLLKKIKENYLNKKIKIKVF